MQKKLIALAILGLTSSAAFADVGVYGVVDGAAAQLAGSGQQSQFLALSGGLAASRLGVKASEKLDNGMTAIAVLEYGIDLQSNASVGAAGAGQAGGSTATNTTQVARQQLLGLAGDFGTVATGYLQTTGYDFGMKYDVTADSAVSPLQNMTGVNNKFLIGTNATASRAQRALAYISPKMGDFSFAVNYSTALSGVGNATLANTAAGTNVTAALVSGSYDHGPLSVGVVYATVAEPSTATVGSYSVSDVAIGASYDFGIATVKATYQSSTNANASATATAISATDTAYSVGAVVPVAVGAVALSYAGNNIGATTANGSSISNSGYTVGYLQPMSKTTTAYVAYSGVTNGTGSSAYSVGNNVLASSTAAGWTSGGGTSSLVAVGLSKKF